MKLDERKPYGTVGGEIEGFPGARYLQGDCFFNGAGDQICPPAEAVIEEEPTKVSEPIKPADPIKESDITSILAKAIPSIVATLPRLSDDDINALYLAEIDGKNRKGVTGAIDEYLSDGAV